MVVGSLSDISGKAFHILETLVGYEYWSILSLVFGITSLLPVTTFRVALGAFSSENLRYSLTLKPVLL